jgi:hypothetical protein
METRSANVTRLPSPLDSLCLMKGIRFGTYLVKYPIKYREKGEYSMLVYQTKQMGLMYGKYSYSDKHYLDLDTGGGDTELYSVIDSINTKVLELTHSWGVNIFSNSIKKGGRMVFRLYNDIKVFYSDGLLGGVSDLKSDSVAKFIITPRDVWVNTIKHQYGINWYIIQVKLMDNVINDSLFIGDGFAGVLIKDHSEYSKFFNMKKMGIPVGAIKLKMSIAGYPDTIIDTGEERCPGCQFCQGSGGGGGADGLNSKLLLEIKGSSDIKKNLRAVKRDIIPVNVIDKVPKLDEILLMRGTLKKTETNKDPYWR